ncbi:hypothetical protein KUM39_18700 [Streptomyces sp. J2-1]|uniref:hypothetical protein n=1 Tax=Streptomyces corallincola TaxID=2851888 RepID=UPI001C38EC92|nr:hypothetical protein [Streptomyces corallincola]MBV2356384.1 hypothetical protein [Streptomyces corallincola]
MAERQEQTAPDALLTRIGQVVMLHHGGDREEARIRLLDLWTEMGAAGDPLHRCTLAHYLADTQDDPTDELAWDLRALSAAQELTDDHDGDAPPGARAFFPSLHLNLAADYAKLGRAADARSHLRRARLAAGALSDDGYGVGVRAAISRLETSLGGESGPGGDGRPGGEGRPGGGGRPGGEGWGPPRQRPTP